MSAGPVSVEGKAVSDAEGPALLRLQAELQHGIAERGHVHLPLATTGGPNFEKKL